VREAVEALNQGDVDAYLGAFAPLCRRWVTGVDEPLDHAVVGDTLRSMVDAFDGFALHEEALFEGADGLVCARWRLEGTHTRDFLGLAASGRAVSVRTCEFYEVGEDGIADTWVYGDPAELFRQITAEAAS